MNQYLRKSLLYSFFLIGILLATIVNAENQSGAVMQFFTDDEPTETLLSPDEAFKLVLSAEQPQQFKAKFAVAAGHYLYQSRIKFESEDVVIDEIKLPTGETKNDPNFGIQEVFHHDFVGTVAYSLKQNETTFPNSILVIASYQGCSEKGLCYAPIKKSITLALPNQPISSQNGQQSVSTNQLADADDGGDGFDQVSHLLKTGNLWLIIAGFFVAGLLLSLTPCVLPMIPILSSIIVGSQSDHQHPSRAYAFFLSLAYVLGMALSYTLAGIAAGLSGNLISQSLQNAWVLGSTAIVFILLSLSMFGFYELKLPDRFESSMRNTANNVKGGHFIGVFIMGALSALIVSPCIAAPLAGALLYIGQTHNVLLGGAGLFALAIGMGVPLLLLGASAGQLLPKAGSWMVAVRQFFGVIMLGMAIWIISPLIPTGLQLALFATLMIVSAIYLHALDRLPTPMTSYSQFWKGIGVLTLIYGIALMLGALSGGKSFTQPLVHLTGLFNHHVEQVNNDQRLNFTTVRNLAELDQKIQDANGKPVMLDFYADWCVACKEMESETFSDTKVRNLLKNTVLLQADVTENTQADQALLKRFGLYGPPGIIFFGANGEEYPSIKTIGFKNAEQFTGTLNRRDACVVENRNQQVIDKC
jgi:thiol:disulfide interchange protein DsbD